MDDSILIDAAMSGASTGYRKGWQDAIDNIKNLAKRTPNAETGRHASAIFEGLEEFSQQAHDEFINSITFTVVTKTDGSSGIQ